VFEKLVKMLSKTPSKDFLEHTFLKNMFKISEDLFWNGLMRFFCTLRENPCQRPCFLQWPSPVRVESFEQRSELRK